MNLEEAKEKVFEAKPVFASLYKKYQNQKWSEYINAKYPRKNNLKNSEEILESLKKIVTPLLGEKFAENATKSLLQNGFADTADHHGLLCHPFFFNLDVAKVSKKIEIRPKIQIVLTVGGISPTNSSFPRSIFFHDKNMDLKKMHLTSLSSRRRPLYGLPKEPREKFEKLRDKTLSQNIPENGAKRLRSFFDETLFTKELWQTERFCDQLTILNDMWWRKIFGDQKGEILYLEVEELVKTILLDFHVNTETLISKILFNKNIREIYIKNYENIIGAHNTKEKTGSHFFWYIDSKEQTRKQLFINGEFLETLDGKTKIPLTPESISKNLSNYSLLPSMALCYSIISFYYGITLGGGFSQIQYLGEMQKAWANTFPDLNKDILNTKTDIFSGEAVIMGISNGTKYNSATLADFLIYTKNPDEANELTEKALQEVSVGESLDGMMDEFLEIITGSYKKIVDLPKSHYTLNV